MSAEPYEVRRSARRKRTMTIFREAGRLVVVVPARLSASEIQRAVPSFVERFEQSQARRRLPAGDPALQARAAALYSRHLAPVVGPAPEFSVRWSSRQQHRWGSATPAEGTIRISDRVRSLPDWVGDYVLMHELVHLVETHHTRRFWELVSLYPETARARGYLEGFSAGQGWSSEEPY